MVLDAASAAKTAAHLRASVRPASRACGDELRAAGVALVDDVVDAEEEAALLALCDTGSWDASLSRRVQHYGHRFAYAEKRCVPTPTPLPPAFRDVVRRLGAPWPNDGGVQCTVNEYLPGQGIAPHVDTHAAFRDGIYALTLGAGVSVRLQRNRRAPGERPVRDVYVGPRSLLALTGEARYVYTHGIASRKGDLVADEWVHRGRRVSLTFRHANDGEACDCGFPHSCDAAAGGAPRLLPTRLRPAPGSAEAPLGLDPPP